MRATQEQFLRYLRLTLGASMRRADSVLAPLRLHLEQGYRWEDEESLEALVAAQDLRDVSDGVLVRLEDFVKKYARSLTKAEKEWLAGAERKKGEGAVGALKKAVQFLGDIDTERMLELEQRVWSTEEADEDDDEAHEMYFMRRFVMGMRMLRLAWTAMYYATQKPSVRRIKMDERESAAFYDVMSPGVRKRIMAEADELAEKTGRLVEVYDADGDRAYVAEQPGTLSKAEQKISNRSARAKTRMESLWAWRPRGQKIQPALALAEVTPEQAQQVREIIASRPGVTIREAAEAVGADVVERMPMEPNPDPLDTDAEQAQDVLMLRDLWEMGY